MQEGIPVKHSGRTVTSIAKIKSYILFAALVWTVISGLSLLWNISYTDKQTLARAYVMARLAFEKDMSFRIWVTNHGGVYVPVTDDTTPNPYLLVPDRDVTTRSGNLTLMNPSYVMRQYYENFEKKGGVRGHITSLKPLRPENKPDPWEEETLLSFKAGKKEAKIIQTLNGEEYVRFMKPFMVAKGCLKCHGTQGYKEGDIRGGISVSVPMAPLRHLERQQIIMLSVVHTLLWLLGLSGIIVFGRIILKSELQRSKTEESLVRAHRETSTVLESISDSLFVLNNDMEVIYFNQAAEKTLGRKREEVIGRKLFDVFPEARGTIFEDKYTEALTNKTSLSFETYFGIPPYSNWYDVRVYANPEGISVYFQIITERKLAEEALLEAENKFRSFSEQALAGIYLIQDGLFKYVNPRFAQMFGYTVEECLEMPFKNLVFPEDLTKVEEQVRRRTSGEIQFVHYTFRGLKKNGEIFYVEIYGSASIYKGKPAALGTILDITEFKQAEEMVARLHHQNELILNAAGEGIVGLDIHGIHTFVNPAAARMLGYAADELIGMHSHTALHYRKADGSLYPEEDCPIYAAYRDGSVHRITEEIFWRKDGTSFPVAYTSTPVIEGETIIGAVVNFRDMTEQRKLEAQLLLSQKLEAIGELAGGIAHDFNNLLQSIIMGIAIAQTRSHEENVREILIQAENECLKAEGLSNLLITFSKGGTPVFEKSSIIDMLKATVLLVLKDSPVDTEFALPDDLWPVEIDEGQIRIAINQLLMNAKEAMPSGGLLKVQARNLESIAGENVPLGEGKYVKITFADSGAGISPENLSKIFDPYFTTKRMGSRKGIGLSLMVSQSIIKKHNGIITAESKAGEGATFHIYLPAAQER
jgi:two-component system, cell cycle sensor histidine kinase and response regulator CckA